MHEAANERSLEVGGAGLHLELDLATIWFQNVRLEIADQSSKTRSGKKFEMRDKIISCIPRNPEKMRSILEDLVFIKCILSL
jgi:hypothetical protein